MNEKILCSLQLPVPHALKMPAASTAPTVFVKMGISPCLGGGTSMNLMRNVKVGCNPHSSCSLEWSGASFCAPNPGLYRDASAAKMQEYYEIVPKSLEKSLPLCTLPLSF